MRIAYVYDVIHPYVIGGVQKRIWEVATRLSRRGHDVTIFGMKHWDGDSIIRKEGVRMWGVCPPRPLFADGRRSIGEAISFATHLFLPLMKESYDIIDAANFPFFPCFTSAFHQATRGSRLIITWHEVWDDYWSEYLGMRGFFGKAIERLAARLPQTAIAVSPRTRDALGRIGRKRAEVVPSGVDTRAMQALPPASTRTDIIFVGRMAKEKNVSLLVEAMRVARDQGRNLTCLLVGDGPEKAHVQSMIVEMHLQSQIMLAGDIEGDTQVLSSMKSSRLLALPSVREGLGLVIIEANACGIPVVVASHPNSAATDLVVEGYNGVICRLSAADLADKMLAVIDRSQPWDNACREFAQKYDWELIVDALEKTYQGP
ncbi:MAG: glycosyltransferase family 4 protein [Dehalococcoidia bacterium]|nr:glycosyltransferase family 4 protein [Dehalococcoidia bacterium]